MLRDVKAGLDAADEMEAGEGIAELGAFSDTHGIGGYIDVSGRVGSSLSLFARGEGVLPYSGGVPEWLAIGGLRYRW